jgi:hypothetical protein
LKQLVIPDLDRFQVLVEGRAVQADNVDQLGVAGGMPVMGGPLRVGIDQENLSPFEMQRASQIGGKRSLPLPRLSNATTTINRNPSSA